MSSLFDFSEMGLLERCREHSADMKMRRQDRSAYVLVVDALHEHQLSVGPLGMGLVLKGPAQLLDGHVSLQVVVVRRTEAKKETVNFLCRISNVY